MKIIKQFIFLFLFFYLFNIPCYFSQFISDPATYCAQYATSITCNANKHQADFFYYTYSTAQNCYLPIEIGSNTNVGTTTMSADGLTTINIDDVFTKWSYIISVNLYIHTFSSSTLRQVTFCSIISSVLGTYRLSVPDKCSTFTLPNTLVAPTNYTLFFNYLL